jgi:hypothetical protein
MSGRRDETAITAWPVRADVMVVQTCRGGDGLPRPDVAPPAMSSRTHPRGGFEVESLIVCRAVAAGLRVAEVRALRSAPDARVGTAVAKARR